MRTRIARILSLGCYLALIAFGMLWAIRLGGLPRNQIALTLLILVLPLLLPLRGVLHARHKALIWGMLVAFIPFLHGGVTAWAEAGTSAAWGGVELLLAAAYIVFGSLYIRWRAEDAAK